MPVSSLKKVFVTSTLLAGAVFSALTIPLVISGSETVVVQVRDEPLFVGKLKDISAPYIGLATALGLGAGIFNFSLAGWKQSSKKSQKIVEQLSGLKQQLKEKEALLEEILVSEPRLQAAGLDFFLDDAKVHQPFLSSSPISAVVQPEVGNSNAAIHEPLLSSATQILQSNVHQHNGQAIAPFLQPTQASATLINSVTPVSSLNQQIESQSSTVLSAPAVSQVQHLQDQLKQMVEQVEQLQNAMQTKSQPSLEQLTQPELTNIVLHQLNNRLHRLESQWSLQEVAS